MKLKKYIEKQQIEALRKGQKLTQNDIADQLGVSPAFLSMLKATKRAPSPETIDLVERATGGQVQQKDWRHG